jgi:hypothetical protein
VRWRVVDTFHRSRAIGMYAHIFCTNEPRELTLTHHLTTIRPFGGLPEFMAYGPAAAGSAACSSCLCAVPIYGRDSYRRIRPREP